MIDIQEIEKSAFLKYPAIARLFTDIMLLLSGSKQVIQSPLCEFSFEELSGLRVFCKQNGLTLGKMLDVLTNEDQLLIFKEKNEKFYAKLLNSTDQKIIGGLYGYPCCCIANLRRLKDRSYVFSPENIKNLFENNHTITVSYKNNFLLADSHFRLFSHLPCSKNCTYTATIAAQTLKTVKSYDAKLYDKYLALNTLNAVFLNDTGIKLLMPAKAKKTPLMSPEIIYIARGRELCGDYKRQHALLTSGPANSAPFLAYLKQRRTATGQPGYSLLKPRTKAPVARQPLTE